jgi:hypothetical protein
MLAFALEAISKNFLLVIELLAYPLKLYFYAKPVDELYIFYPKSSTFRVVAYRLLYF